MTSRPVLLISAIILCTISTLHCSPVIQGSRNELAGSNSINRSNRISKDMKLFQDNIKERQNSEAIENNRTTQNEQEEPVGESKGILGRTFGLRRLKIAIPLIMFKLGAMMMLLGFLTLIALKTLALVIFLVISQVSGFLAKFHLAKYGGHEESYGHGWSKDVHLHVHKDPGGHFTSQGPWHEGPYHAWAKNDDTTAYGGNLHKIRNLESLYQQEI